MSVNFDKVQGRFMAVGSDQKSVTVRSLDVRVWELHPKSVAHHNKTVQEKLLIGYRVNVRMMDIKPFIKREMKPPPCRIFNRRRLKRTCGECGACNRVKDCGKCDFCRDKPKFGGRNVKHQKCRWRQCHLFPLGKKQIGYKFHEANTAIKRLNRIKYPAAKAPPGRKRRFQRMCNKCGPCTQKEDCGKCDFCLDKLKFGGPNLKRQKCRSRQCKFFALPHLKILINRKKLVLPCKKRQQVDHDDEWEWDRAKRRRRMKMLSARKKLRKLHQAAQQTSHAIHTPMRSPPQVVVKEEFKERYLNVENHRIVLKDAFVLLKRLEDITECPTWLKEERYLHTEVHENLKVVFVLLKRLDDYTEYQTLVKEAKGGCPFTVRIKEDSTEHGRILDCDGKFEWAAKNRPHAASPKEDCMESAPGDEKCMLESATSETFHLDIEDFLIKGEEEESADGDSLPVITEIISIGGRVVISRLNCDGPM